MKTLHVLACLFLGGAAMAAIDTPMKPTRVQEVTRTGPSEVSGRFKILRSKRDPKSISL